MRKLLDFFKLLKKIRHEVKVVKPQLVYVIPNACGGAFYKDFVVVQMLKRLGCQVVVRDGTALLRAGSVFVLCNLLKACRFSAIFLVVSIKKRIFAADI